MTHRRPALTCLLLALSFAAAACDQGPTPIGGFDSDGCDPPADDGPRLDIGAPAEQPLAIDCSFAFLDTIETIRLEANDELDYPVGGDLKVSAAFFDDDFEGRSFHVTVYTDAGTVGSTALYQLGAGARPVNEFFGDHGFTGLNSVKDPASSESLQYACFARDPADPIQGWVE